MTRISELIILLEAIKREHGDVPVKYMNGVDGYGQPYNEDIAALEFITDKDEPETSDNPYSNGFVIIY